MWGAIIALVAAGVGAYSSYQQGKQQEKIYDYNAALAERQAEEERQAAKYAADIQREQGEALKARQRLLFNVSGVTLEGTPEDLLADTAKQLERDAKAIEYGGQSKGTALDLQANLMRMQGTSARRAGWWNAGTSLLSGASTAYNSYYGGKL